MIHMHMRRKEIAKSFQSEDVLDTIEEMGKQNQQQNFHDYEEQKDCKINKDLDQALMENSSTIMLNKSHITMEDNNKA